MKSEFQWGKSGWQHPLSTAGVQRGTEDDELEERGFQGEGIECVKIQRQEGADAITEIHTKQYGWNIMCV